MITSLISIAMFIYFLFAVTISFLIPGYLVIPRKELNYFQRFVIAAIVGMALWGLQGFLFGYLHIRILTYFYLLISLVFWFKFESNNFLKFLKSHIHKKKIFSLRIDMISLLIIILGVFIQVSTTWFVGTRLNNAIFFCCGNTGDNYFHAALTKELVHTFPPNEPGMSGVLMKNYHFMGNLVAADLIRIFHIPLFPIVFQDLALFISIFLGLALISFTQLLKMDNVYKRFLLLFFYFGSDLIFLLIFISTHKIIFSTGALESGSMLLSNLPRAFSIVVFIATLQLFVVWLKDHRFSVGLLLPLVGASLISFKVYTGILLFSGYFFLSLYYLYRRKIRIILPLILTIIIAICLYLPVNYGSGGLYFTGFWRFENFIVQPVFGLIRLELAREIYVQHHNWLRLIEYEAIFFFLYIFFIFGTKLIALIQTKKTLMKFPIELNIILISGIIVSFIAGAFFEQQSGEANTFNFLVSVFIFISIYAALASWNLVKKLPKVFGVIFIITIVILTVPKSISDGISNIANVYHKNGIIIDADQLDAFSYLNSVPNSSSKLLLVDNRNIFGDDQNSPYVSIFVNNPMFLSGDMIIDSHAANLKDVQELKHTILFSRTNSILGKAILKSKIRYILTYYPNDFISTKSANFFSVVYKNRTVEVLRISRNKIANFFKSLQ